MEYVVTATQKFLYLVIKATMTIGGIERICSEGNAVYKSMILFNTAYTLLRVYLNVEGRG